MTVETFDGSRANKKECRFIKGNFYIKNKQCFLIDGVWYRINSGFIVYDNERNNWVVAKNNPSLIKGIIGYDDMTKDVILGWYTPNDYKNVRVSLPNGNQLSCMSVNILPSSVFKEDIKNMCFVPNSVKTSPGIPPINFNSNGYPFPLQYCVKHYDKKMMEIFNSGVDKRRTITQTNIATWVQRIEPFSFGFEFETNRGKIPNYRIMNSGLVPLRDGSITGIEYATVPLSGKSGIVDLEEMCTLLQRYTTFTEQESLHLHIGNIPTGKRFIGYLYTMCCILEKDIFSIFPKYYAQTSKFKAKGKDYNMPLKKELVAMTPEETFDNIAFYLSEGKKYQGFGAEHPSDPEGHSKWSIQSRYHFVNFIPCFLALIERLSSDAMYRHMMSSRSSTGCIYAQLSSSILRSCVMLM